MSIRIEVAVRIADAQTGTVVVDAMRVTALVAPADTALEADLGEAGARLSEMIDAVRGDALDQVAALAAAVASAPDA